MNDLDIINKYNLKINKITQKGKVRIIDTNKGKYVIKKVPNNNLEIDQYLTLKKFPYIVDREIFNNYEIYKYIEENKNIPLGDKAIDYIYILSLLHNKTTFYKETSLDKTKEIYENLSNEIDNLNYYYHDLQDVIEKSVYQSPAEYLLIRNMSLIYVLINDSKKYLDSWYDIKKEEEKERIVLLHNNANIYHFIYGYEEKLISFENCKRDMPIYDFVNFYKNNYMDLEMKSLFDKYKSKFPYTNSEYLLFLALISIPEKIVFTRNNYINQEKVYRLIKYVEKTREFLLYENENGKKEK